MARRAIVASSHIIICDLDHYVDFASFITSYRFDSKCFLKIDCLPFLFRVLVGILHLDNQLFGKFIINFVFEFVCAVFLVVMGQNTKSSKHNVSLACELDCIIVVATHVIIIIMLNTWESLPD